MSLQRNADGESQQNLEKIGARLRETDAKLIWCATTPDPEFEVGRNVGDEIKYNRTAESIMKKNDIAINDLPTYALQRLPVIQIEKGDVHFTKPGYAYLAEQVASEIESTLASLEPQE
ncbi:hypothetical protein FHS27_003472 [Rhodopirellula rubra]|uniref:Uncharacterized protein n=1 Tax=Aporhodopirellula rubra TaxID=980271 RepID=A0A7W5E1L4_9BACT|nr:SGNH/GDSL hydrolase family protein [Aporhodopirellula rubra]MBB3207647.1 hypothetical protein [Aporhodopirellula rubra]